MRVGVQLVLAETADALHLLADAKLAFLEKLNALQPLDVNE